MDDINVIKVDVKYSYNGSSVAVTPVKSASMTATSALAGPKGEKGDKGDTGTTDYNDLINLPDLTLKADKSDTYTKIEVDTSLAGKAELVHVHAISDVTGLQTALDGKSATGHTHTAANVTDFDAEVSNNTDVAANTAARHTHANTAVLNATTASFTTADETKLSNLSGTNTGDNLIIGTTTPTPSIGAKVLWLDTTGGNITLNLVTGE